MIIRMWESPQNRDTAIFRVGDSVSNRDWNVGRILEQKFAGRRICVYDSDDKLRISFPMEACGIEYDEYGTD